MGVGAAFGSVGCALVSAVAASGWDGAGDGTGNEGTGDGLGLVATGSVECCPKVAHAGSWSLNRMKPAAPPAPRRITRMTRMIATGDPFFCCGAGAGIDVAAG